MKIFASVMFSIPFPTFLNILMFTWNNLSPKTEKFIKLKRINVFQRFDILCVSFAGAVNVVKHKTEWKRHPISILIIVMITSLFSEDYMLSKNRLI